MSLGELDMTQCPPMTYLGTVNITLETKCSIKKKNGVRGTASCHCRKDAGRETCPSAGCGFRLFLFYDLVIPLVGITAMFCKIKVQYMKFQNVHEIFSVQMFPESCKIIEIINIDMFILIWLHGFTNWVIVTFLGGCLEIILLINI